MIYLLGNDILIQILINIENIKDIYNILLTNNIFKKSLFTNIIYNKKNI